MAQTDLKEFLLGLNQDLQILQERKAKYGGNVPLELLNQIDDHRRAIDLTEQVLAGALSEAEWQAALPPLLISATRQELLKIQQAIAAQEALRGILPPEQLEATLANLRHKEADIQAQLSGVGAQASGAAALAVAATGSDSLAIGKIGRDLIQGHKLDVGWMFVQVVNQPAPDPAELRFIELRQRYLANLAHDCDVLRLSALGGDQEIGKQVKLSQVYIDLNTTQTEPVPEAEKDHYLFQSERPLPALKATAQSEQIALLGDPGSGKSTFVKQLAAWVALAHLGHEEALAHLETWPGGYWPLLLNLRDLGSKLAELALAGLSDEAQEQRLTAAVQQQWQAELARLRVAELSQRLEDILTAAPLLLIFDGLDEVPETVRPRVRLAIQAIRRAYPNVARLIVTSRIRSYTEAVALPGFERYTLARFNQNQISDFVAGWYQAQGQLNRWSEEEISRRTQDLQGAALASDLRELAENPMLLTVMAIIHQRRVQLPPERVRLYSEAVKILLEGWQKHKGIPVSPELQAVLSDSSRLRLAMQHLAYAAHRLQSRQGPEARLSRQEILALLEAEHVPDIGLASQFLDYVDQRAGLLVGLGGDEASRRPQTYDFPHRTFQEYLAGCYLVTGREQTVRRAYWQRVAEGDYWYLAGQYGAEALIYSERPEREKLLDLAYALCPAPPPQETTHWRAALWSGQMAALLGTALVEADKDCGPDDGPAYLKRLLGRLMDILAGSRLSPLERAEVGNVLAKLGDPRPEVMTLAGMQLCYIPPGPLVMGSHEADDEKPAHELDLEYGYWIGRYPVTVAQFRAFVEASGQQLSDEDALRDPPNRPVRYVTWHEALAFCGWLSEQGRADGWLPDGWQVTLPSEAEWEKAARGGRDQPETARIRPLGQIKAWRPELALVANDGATRRYPWGDAADPNRANFNESGLGTTNVVGCFPGGVSPYGVEEMSGNVWEWTRSLWGEGLSEPDYKYPYRPDDGRENLEASDRLPRVLRGGAFGFDEEDVRCAVRDRYFPNYWYDLNGFRVACHVTT